MTTTPDADGPFDYVIVGAGASGCVLAARLSEDPNTRVLLLEAGAADDNPDIAVPLNTFRLQGTSEVNRQKTVGQTMLNGRSVPLRAGSVLGGGGSVNFLVWHRGHPHDYDGWAAAGMTGWGWDDVLPVLKRSEDHELGDSALHSVGGPIAITRPRDVNPLTQCFIQAGTEAGLPHNDDFNGAALDGVGLAYSNVRQGERDSTATAYLRPALARINLTVRTSARVRRVTFTDGRATGVEYSDANATTRWAAAASVVLAAGALRSPQLLMLSGIGPAEHLHEHGIDVVVDAPEVGANLQDHASVPVVWPVTHGRTWEDAVTAAEEELYRTQRRGPLAALCEGAAFLRCAPGATAPDIQITAFLKDYTNELQHGFSAIVTLAAPSSRGLILLCDDDPDSFPLVDPAYLTVAGDVNVLVEGVRQALRIGDQPALRAVLGPARLPSPSTDFESYVRQTLVTINHPVGTCRAGSDATSVVDPWLQVRGVQGLTVADASVMPVIPCSNTYAPTVMIGERAADILQGPQWGTCPGRP